MDKILGINIKHFDDYLFNALKKDNELSAILYSMIGYETVISYNFYNIIGNSFDITYINKYNNCSNTIIHIYHNDNISIFGNDTIIDKQSFINMIKRKIKILIILK